VRGRGVARVEHEVLAVLGLDICVQLLDLQAHAAGDGLHEG
jgi:hypothetical protein